MAVDPDLIYHVVPDRELRAGLGTDGYLPARFDLDGFVHCSASARSVLAVAGDLFGAQREPLWVLCIDPARLRAKLVFEAPAPVPGGSEHLQTARTFPHVYGPIDALAIRGIGLLARSGTAFLWPDRFAPLRSGVSGWSWI